MADVSGTLQSVMLDNIPFDVVADVNVTEIGSSVESEMIPTSGRNMRKLTKRSQNREGVVLVCNDQERAVLKTLAEKTQDFPMSYTTASGSTYTAVGSIEFESRETQENRASIIMQPRKDWDEFLA